MNNDMWEPVALIPATLSDEASTAIEVAETRGGIYLLPMEPDSDTGARDCCMTMDEARQLALAILAITDPEPTAAQETCAVVRSFPSARRGAALAGSVRLQAAV